MPDLNARMQSSLRQASQILPISTPANEFEHEQNIAHPIEQRFAVGSARTSERTNIITQPDFGVGVPLLDESAITLNQFRQTEVPQSYEYKAPADIKQESTVTLRTDTLAISGDDMESQETPVNVGHIRRQELGGIKQVAKSVSQPSVAIDFPILDESAIYLDQLQRPELPESVSYKAPADMQSTTGSLRMTASALSEVDSSHEASITINQFTQPTAQHVPVSDTLTQQVSTIIQPSAITDVPIMQEALIRLDQVQRPEIPQNVQYKAPADLQPVAASLLTTAAAAVSEEPAQETAININQLRQPMVKDVSTSNETQQQAASEIVQSKAPTDIEPTQEVPINVSQMQQTTAQTLSDVTKQNASIISPIYQAIGMPLLDDTPLNIDQIQRTETPQSYEYKAPADIKPISATLQSTPSVLASDIEHDQIVSASVEGYQQQQGHITQRTSVVSDLSYASAEQDFSELPNEIKVQQQRLLKMQPKLLEQPTIIQSATSLVESDDQTQGTAISQRRQMIPSLKKEEEEEETDKTISPETSMMVDEVIETIHLEDELLEPKKQFTADITTPSDVDVELSTLSFVDVLPSIAELTQGAEQDVSVTAKQPETTSADQILKEEIQTISNVESQPLINQLDQVSSTQVISRDSPTAEEASSYVIIEQTQPKSSSPKAEEAFESSFEKIVDYIEIPPSKTDHDDNKPEAIIIIDEIQPMVTSFSEGKFE